jgi:hypothetical protein
MAVGVEVGAGVVGVGVISSRRMYTGVSVGVAVGVAVHTWRGVGVAVPVAMAAAVNQSTI